MELLIAEGWTLRSIAARLGRAENLGSEWLLHASLADAAATPIICRLTAEALDMPVSSIRPIPFHGAWRLAVTAKMWEGRIRDRLGL